MRLDPNVMMGKAETAWRRKRMYYGIWSECWRYAAPGVDPFRTSQGAPEYAHGQPDGSPRYDHLFDSTLAYSSDKHANMLMHRLFPDGREWGELAEGLFLEADVGGDRKARSKAIENTQKRLFQAINASNFTKQGGSMVKDGVVSGTGCMKVGISSDRSALLEFDAVNQAQVAFERGPTEALWAYYRKMQVLPDHFSTLWPDGENFPSNEKMEGSSMPKEYDVMEATYFDKDEGIWQYDVILEDPQRGSDHVRIFSRTYVICPWVAWRYWLAPGEVQGRSPVMAALPDARTTNKVVETRLRNGSIRTPGIYTYRANDVFNPATAIFEAGAFLPVGSNDTQNPTIRALEMAGDPQFGELVLEDTRASIRRTLLDLGLPEMTGAVRSATEIIERMREMQETLGQPFVRLIAEVGRPILRACAYLLQQEGQLPELADVNPVVNGQAAPLRLDGSDIAVTFTSPLSTSQQLSDAQTTIRWGEASRAIAGDAAFEAAVKTEELPVILQRKMGAPAELIRDDREKLAEQNRAAQLQAGMGGLPQMAPGAMEAPAMQQAA